LDTPSLIFALIVILIMPTLKRNWCAHPRHLETYPDGRKMFTKVGPKPNHPLGSRRISLDLCNFINETCVGILKDVSLKLNENHWLCYEQELTRFETAASEQLHIRIEKLKIDEHFCESDGYGDVGDSPNLVEEKQDFCIKKLNEVFKIFHMEPVVPYV
jgi:hypothetical protein